MSMSNSRETSDSHDRNGPNASGASQGGAR